MRELGNIAGLVAAMVVLAGCPPRGMDAPPTGPTSQPGAEPASAPAPGAARKGATRPNPGPAATEGGELVAVPPWIDLEDPKDHAWVDGMRRAVRVVAPQALRCRDEAPAAAPACLCKVLCTVKFPPLKQREGHAEISYPPLPGGGPALRSFRLRPDGVVESCTIRSGDPEQPGARTTEIVWCSEPAAGARPEPKDPKVEAPPPPEEKPKAAKPKKPKRRKR